MRRIMMIVSAILLGSLATAAQSNQASDVPTHAAFNYDANYANDRAEIENLSARYMIAMDDYDGDAYAATFTPDAVLIDGGGVHRGRQQIHDRTANQVQTARSGLPLPTPRRRRTRKYCSRAITSTTSLR